MANEQFSLCWDNFHSNMSNGLTSLLKTEDLVDVTLAAEGRYLKAHKMVLSVCSPYFRELFQVNPCKHPIVFLKDVSFNALNNLLEFMYQGEVKVSQEDLGTFIKTAEALKIKGLTGDGPTQNDTASEPTPTQNNVTSSEPGPPTRKIAREKSPPVRKKMLGPASKRFKADADTPPPLVTIQQQQPQIQPQTAIQISSVKEQTVEEQIVQFKLEPEETAVSLTNDEDETYDDSAMDDMGIDNSTDYMMENTSEVEVRDVKAGTSTAVDNADATGDNQGSLMYMVNRRGQMALIFENNIFHVNRRYEDTTFWKCMEYKKLQCKCRCTTVNGAIRKSKTDHNHPPNIQKIQKKFLQMKCISTSDDPASLMF